MTDNKLAVLEKLGNEWMDTAIWSDLKAAKDSVLRDAALSPEQKAIMVAKFEELEKLVIVLGDAKIAVGSAALELFTYAKYGLPPNQ